MTFRFTKMHGTGNDYVYVNGFEQEIENPGELSIRISDRHFGHGSDGLILIVPSKVAGLPYAYVQCRWIGGCYVWQRDPLCGKICV